MSTSELALAAQPVSAALPRGDTTPAAQRIAWWHRVVPTCASRSCAHRGKLWPARLRKNAGIAFEARWFCEPACLQALLEYRVRNLLSTFRAPKAKSHRLPLGLLLVEQAAISNLQLREALRLQRETASVRIGDLFLRAGIITEHQLTAALAQQWGCPVFPLDAQRPNPSWSSLLPLAILDSARAVPAYASADSRTLHLAFADRLDHTLLYAIEQLLDCRTVACMAPQSAVSHALSQLRTFDRPEISFDTVRDAGEISSIICSYAQELRPARIAVSRVTAHLWVRFYRRDANRDLLFRMLPDSCSNLNQPPLNPSPLADFPKPFSFSADNRKDGVSDAALHL